MGKKMVAAMYSVLHFSEMAADPMRMDAYERAIAAAVQPGSVVLDLGAGTGICTLLALHAGAARVHACEPSPAVWLIRDLARENGVADRVVIHPTTSWELELGERVDVVVSDLRGALPLFGDHFAVLRDVTRFLAPGGVLLPQRDDFHVALVENEAFAHRLALGTAPFESRGWSARAVRSSITHGIHLDKDQLRASDVLAVAEKPWGHVVYGDAKATLEGEVRLSPRRGGVAFGLAIWFDATIAPGATFSTAPGTQSPYSRLVLPLPEPTRIDVSDQVTVALDADESGERWAWTTTIRRADGAVVRFRQTTFFGQPASPEALLRGSSTHVPTLNASGARARRILELCDGRRSIEAIAAELAAHETRRQAALVDEVRALVARYGR